MNTNSRKTIKKSLAAASRSVVEQMESRVLLSVNPFTPGDIAVYRIGNGSTALSTSSTAVFIDEYTPSGSLVQSIAMPISDSVSGTADSANAIHALTATGNALSEGELNLSANGQALTFVGYDTSTGTPSVGSSASGTINRTVAVLGVSGQVDTTTALSDLSSGGNVRAAVSTDGTHIWLAGQDAATGGVRYISSLGVTTSTNLTGTTPKTADDVAIFGNQLFGSGANSGILSNVALIGSGLPTTTGQNTTTLAGIPTSSSNSPNAFFFARLGTGATVAGYDTLYVADDTGNALTKYTLNVAGTSWTATGKIGAGADDLFGLTGRISGSTVTLYATEESGAQGTTGPVKLVSIVDASGYAGTLSATPTVLVTGVANKEALKGVALVPDDGVGAIGGLGGTTNYTQNASAMTIAGAATFTDSSNFDGGKLVVSGGQSSDTLSINSQGNGAGQIGVSGSTISYGGTQIGTFTGGGGTTPLTITFNSVGGNVVTGAAVQSLINQVAFFTNAGAGTRTVSFQVTENSGASDTATTQTVNIIAGIHNAPAQSANAGLTVAQRSTTVITKSILLYTSTDPASQLTYTFSGPTNGTLKLSGVPVSSFTQADINAGNVTYVQNGSDTTSDSFAFTVTDAEDASASDTFSIAITAPVLVNNSAALAQAGGSVTLDNTVLDTTEQGAQLIYTIGTAPASGTLTNTNTSTTLLAGATFTQSDIDNGFITYSNINTSAENDSFTFTVTDGGTGSTGLQTFVFNINHAPSLSAHAGLSVNPGQGATIASSLLSVTDSEQSASQLTYTVSMAPTAGALNKSVGSLVTALAVGDTFTQADINSGNIFFVGGSSIASDSFSFAVSDGAGGSLGSSLFALNVVAPSSVSYSSSNTLYAQNFDGLPTTGADTLYSAGPISLDTSSIPTTGLAGWSFGDAATVTEKFFVGDGAAGQTTGGVYSFGTGTDTPGTPAGPSSDRALGLQGTTTLASAVGVTFVNNTGKTLSDITIDYNGELWHLGNGTTANPLTFGYALGASSILDSATFLPDANLNYSYTPTGLSGAVDGNAHQTAKSSTIGGVNWAPGQTLVLRWSIGGVTQAPGLAIDDFTFSADAAPVVATNTGLITQVGQAVNITHAMLSTTDADNTADQLTYTVTSLPTNGTLSINGVVQTDVGGTFTEAQLATGTYVAFTAGSSKVGGSFGFTVADPAGITATGSFNAGIGDAVPVLATNVGLTLIQGANATINTSLLKVTDVDNTDAELTFTVGAPPAHGTLTNTNTSATLAAGATFTEQDLDSGYIKYANDNSANASDGFTFTVDDGQGGTISSNTFNIIVNLIPVVAVNTGLSTPIAGNTSITSTMLSSSEALKQSSQITYTVTGLPTEGTLEKGGVALTIGSTFTQKDINGTSIISYVNNAAAAPGSSDSFSFTVADDIGTATGSNTFQISVDTPTSISYGGGSYTQDFDGLPTAGTFAFAQSGPFDLGGSTSATPAQGVGALGMAGWSMAQAGGSTVNTEKFFVNSGNGQTTGGVYSFGNFTGDAAKAGNLALGLVGTGSNNSEIGLTLVNTTGRTLTQFSTNFIGEQWLANTTTNTLTFNYALGASSITDAAVIGTDPNLNYTGSETAGTSTGLDGALASNQTTVGDTITGLNWAPGEVLVLRWQIAGTGKAAGLAIDDLNFSAQSTPTVTVSDAGGAYKGADYAATPLVNGAATLQSIAPTLTYYVGSDATGASLGSTAPSGVGSYSVVANFAGSADYTAAESVPANFNITQATPVANVNAVNITYGAVLANIQLSGTASANSVSVPGKFTYTSAAGVLLGAGNGQNEAVTFTPTDTVDYAIISTMVAVNVAKANPSVTVTDAGGPVTGAAYPADAKVAGVVSGVDSTPSASLEGVTPTVVYYAGSTATGTPLSDAPSAAGMYTVVANFSGSADYASATSNPVKFAIGALPAATVAVTSGDRVYNGAAYAPSATITGSKGADSGAMVTYTYYTGTTTTGSPLSDAPARVGTYTVVAHFSGDSTYAAANSPAHMFHITPKALTGSVSVTNKVYDGTTVGAISSRLLTGVVAGDAVALAGGVAKFADNNVGTKKSVTVTGLTLSGAAASNYVLSNPTETTTANITARSLVVTANNFTRVYGQPNPAFTATISGLIAADGITSSETTAAAQYSPGGTYAIVPALKDPNHRLSNYAVTIVKGTLIVQHANTTTTVRSVSAKHGTGTVTLTAAVSANSPSRCNIGTGHVTFIIEDTHGTHLRTVNSGTTTNGIATAKLSLSGLAVGSYSIVAVFVPDPTKANFNPSTSAIPGKLTLG